ncbi:MAG: DEAD/DEAH box helicase family protein [Lachnospiraceae bacterium]|nr:DEAD/DEAH box helicase family protein [Lachnospiraceae bacterium]
MAKHSYEELDNLYREIVSKVSSNAEEWLNFVKTASNLYRYPFADQLLIYAQRPEAQQCAPIDYWNKNLLCYVNKGAQGIALLDRNARGSKIKYVFDMADVHKVSDRSIMPYQWNIPDEARDFVLAGLENTYRSTDSSRDFAERLIEIADYIASDNLSEFMNGIIEKIDGSTFMEIYEERREEIFQDALSASIASMLLTRCGVDVSQYADKLTGLQYVNMFNTMDTLGELGAAASSLSKPVLIGIEKSVMRYEKQYQIENKTETEYNRAEANTERGEDNGDQVRTERGLHDSEAESERSSGGAGSTLEVWAVEGEISEETQAWNIRDIPDDGGFSGTSGDDRPTGDGEERSDYRADEESRGRESRTSGNELDGVRSATDSNRAGSGSDRSGGNDLRVSKDSKYEQLSLFPTVAEQVESVEAAEKELTAAFSVADDPELEAPKVEQRSVSEQIELLEDENAGYRSLIGRNDVSANFHITDYDLGKGGAKEKFRRNVDAIKTLRKIEDEDRAATPEEQQILSQYIGWGGLSVAFDDRKPNWSKEYNELKDLLTPEEYAAARSTTRDAFYTSPEIINGIYNTLDRMGFEKGNILEPAMGVGNFFGMLPEKMRDSKLYGVELDSISGRIAKLLYPDAQIQISGYQDTNFGNNTFDVAVGNVPFDSYVPFDKDYSKQRFMLHDYFFAKTLDKVRPGGVIAFVTSKGTMDKEDPKVRKYIAQRAELLGAVRLPGGKDGAFKDNAGTEVTTDILFLQKRDSVADVEPDWVHLGLDDKGISINQYFIDHPEQIVGHMEMVSGQFGLESSCVADTDRPFKEQYNNALSGVRGQYVAAVKREEKTQTQEEVLLPSPEDKNYSFVLKNDKVYYREDAALIPQKLKGNEEERIKGMVAIRDMTQDLLNIQLTDAGDLEIEEQQLKLSDAYDAFVAQYGRIDSEKNKKLFSKDNSSSLIRSLEVFDENGNFERKADIFTKRTIQRAEVVTSVESASEALTVSINEKAAVDLDYMSKLCHKPVEEVVQDLQGVIFRNPLTDRFETSDEYLSGNVRNKLAVAKSYAEQNPEFQINVTALEAVQPAELSAGDIDVRLGTTWIDPQYIKDFMHEILGTPNYELNSGTIDCKYTDVTSAWWIEGKTKDRNNVKINNVFGTPRRNAYQILEDSLNLKSSEVYDTFYDAAGRQTRKINKEETIVAQQKQDTLKEAFRSWIFADPERRETLVNKYNVIFNSTRPREYNGEHLKLPGSNPQIQLKEHQKNGVARILYGDNTLLAHTVGAGKTFTMIAGAMESKRLGLCKKSMFVVPNHLTEQWGSDFRTLYPNANILVATKDDFSTENRRKFCSRIATGDYDAVIIGHTQFEKIPMSYEKKADFIQTEIDEATMARESLNEKEDRHSVKEIEGFVKRQKEKLKDLLESKDKDDVVTFEQLGVDRLFVDESHYYKNLYMPTKMSRVAGVQTSDAQKSTDMLMKCRYMDEITGGKGITFASGTPISNSMTELYTNMRYLQNAKLKEMGLTSFDKWASSFGETTTAMEVSPEGTNYRAKTRFAKFFNLPELISAFKEAADIRTADMLDLPVPDVEYENVILEKSPEQDAIIKSIGERADKIRNGSVDASIDNMLKITNDGRKMALDQRLYSDVLPDNPDSKAAACVKRAFQIYKDTMKEKSTQLIFCDLGTPGGKREVEGSFNVYEDLKKKLMDKGVPENEIAFIHDADSGKNADKKKDELFGKVRIGKVRFLIGSTQKMGAGTNVQDRLIALHHLDVPWRPSDLEQQEGRILRRGNQNPKVKIFRYITKGTFDTYNWQTIEKKQAFISQIMTSKSPVRSHEDVDDATLKYAEVKALASDNPLIAEKMTLEVEVQKLRVAKSAYTNQIYSLQDNIAKNFPAQISHDKELVKGYKADIGTYNSHKPADKDSFSITLGNRTYTDKKEGAETLHNTIRNNAKFMGDYEKIGSYCGFDVCMKFDLMFKKFDLKLVGETAHYVNDVGHDAFGTVIKINNVLEALEKNLEHIEQRVQETEKQLEIAKIEVMKPFPKAAELSEKQQRLSEVDALLKMDEKETPIVVTDEQNTINTESCEQTEKDVRTKDPQNNSTIFAVVFKNPIGESKMSYIECPNKEAAETYVTDMLPGSTIVNTSQIENDAIPAGELIIHAAGERALQSNEKSPERDKIARNEKVHINSLASDKTNDGTSATPIPDKTHTKSKEVI